MPRIRTVKPEFFMHDGLASLDPLVRLLFIGMWTVADKAGRLKDKPKRIKAEVLPYDDCDIDSMLDALAQAGHIERYDAEGESYIQVTGWTKHQNVSKSRENESKIPAHAHSGEALGTVESMHNAHTTSDERVKDACIVTQGKEGERKGKDKNNPPTPHSGGGVRNRLSDDEYRDLTGRYGQRVVDDLLRQIDVHMLSTGQRYKSIHATVVSWAERKGIPLSSPPRKPCTNPDCMSGWVLPPGRDAAIPCPDCSKEER